MSGRKLWTQSIDPFQTDEPIAQPTGYQAWKESREGWARELAIIPAESSRDTEWYIPYLQTITVFYDRESGHVGLICHSSDMLVMIEGHGLQPLARLIGRKKVEEVRVYDPAKDGPLDGDAGQITAIRVTRGGET